MRQVGLLDHHQAVGLLHVRGGLGEEVVGRDADGAADRAAGRGPGDLFLHLPRDALGFRSLALAADEFAGHLVDGADVGDGDGAVDRLYQAPVPFDVQRRSRGDNGDARTARARLAHHRAGGDAMGLRLVAGGDQAGGFRVHRSHAHRPAAQRRHLVLFHRGEVAVEVDEQAAQAHGRTFRGEPGGIACTRRRGGDSAARKAPQARVSARQCGHAACQLSYYMFSFMSVSVTHPCLGQESP